MQILTDYYIYTRLQIISLLHNVIYTENCNLDKFEAKRRILTAQAVEVEAEVMQQLTLNRWTMQASS
jgi:hypothetical protein